MRLPPFLKHPAFDRFDSANLRLRVISAAIMAPVALIAVYIGGIVYAALAALVVTVGLYEWLRLVAPEARARTVGSACAMLIVVMAAGFIISVPFGAMLAVIGTLALFLVAARDRDERAGWMALGIPYMGGSGLALLALRDPAIGGAELVFYLLITVWATDIGAFVSGRIIGGPKLAPAVSPSKTWAGLCGGIALATLLGYFAADRLGANCPSVALLLSPLLACVAQLGDLFESYFKRRSGVKESGDLIPGHGGVLDRIDGLVFAGVFAYLFQSAIGDVINWW